MFVSSTRSGRDLLGNLQALRAIAAINVVLFHMIGSAESYGVHARWFPLLGKWGASGVDLFFVISGFVMVYAQARSPKGPVDFLLSRARRIVPIYWVLSFGVLALLFTASVSRNEAFSRPCPVFVLFRIRALRERESASVRRMDA